MRRISHFSLALVTWWLLAGNSSPSICLAVRITSDPYAAVDWVHDVRLKTQFHDHVNTNADRIIAYDQAGYDVVSLMHYSGAAWVQGAWQERRWPPEDWLPPELLESLENIRFLIPSAEEVAPRHIVSAFLTEYIEYRHPSLPGEREPYQYGSTNEGIELIRSLGGLPIVAHPIECCGHLRGYHAVEIYSGFPAHQFWTGDEPVDHNDGMLAFWDERLMVNPNIYGVAVNDWYGPWYPLLGRPYSDEIIDSGKTIVIADEATPSSFRDAVEAGSMFAVQDIGAVKDQYPHIESISIVDDMITVETEENVRWISNGQLVGSGRAFDASLLPPESRYLRAEIGNDDGSIVYTQPWAIAPSTVLYPGDADMDGDFDQSDLVQVQVAGRYDTGQFATWGEGDWNGGPGGYPGHPPPGDGVFDPKDVVSALQTGAYRSEGQRFDAGKLVGVDLAHGPDLSPVSAPVPEPSTLALLAVATIGFALRGGWPGRRTLPRTGQSLRFSSSPRARVSHSVCCKTAVSS